MALLSTEQIERMKVLGVDVDTEGGVRTGLAGASLVIYDSQKNTRKPVFIRIQNMHATEPVRIAEGIRGAAPGGSPGIIGDPLCDAQSFTHVIAPGTATDDGRGGGVEWDLQRPDCIVIQATNAWRVTVCLRYAAET